MARYCDRAALIYMATTLVHGGTECMFDHWYIVCPIIMELTGAPVGSVLCGAVSAVSSAGGDGQRAVSAALGRYSPLAERHYSSRGCNQPPKFTL